MDYFKLILLAVLVLVLPDWAQAQTVYRTATDSVYVGRDGLVISPGLYLKAPIDSLDNTAIVAASGLVYNVVAGTAYTLAASDAKLNALITTTSSSDVTITVDPQSSVPIDTGKPACVRMQGTGTVTFSAGSGVTINTPGALTITTTGGFACLDQTATDVWWISGDI